MATKHVRKLLFSIFIVGNNVSSLQATFTKESITKENAEEKFGLQAIAEANAASLLTNGSPRVEQVGFYYDQINSRGVLTGVADANGLIEITEGDKPQLVGMDAKSGTSEVVQAFVASIVEQAGLPRDTSCTWVIVPLDELGGGFGTLHLGGMAGISGG